ncbi:PREDICTED: glutaredoxin-C9-like [Nelumbo nucifera]|uniref:Glutaredoxin-C9-like n=1 Tax=Nelumbo nucifera TaxID=4432 RepID=A0A1U8ADQ2_NELNU|nr:PREDICTED: glutaredoxin-C9-like [Nelumbo nucifera]
MQQALPYRAWLPVGASGSAIGRASPAVHMEEASSSLAGKSVKGMVSENAVIVFGKRGCCMCHVMKRLLLGLGVNPAVCEVDEADEVRVVEELATVGDGNKDHGRPQFPAVFIGGRLFGGLDRLMGAHISGDLIPVLKQAGALWL